MCALECKFKELCHGIHYNESNNMCSILTREASKVVEMPKEYDGIRALVDQPKKGIFD